MVSYYHRLLSFFCYYWLYFISFFMYGTLFFLLQPVEGFLMRSLMFSYVFPDGYQEGWECCKEWLVYLRITFEMECMDSELC